jgi:hypothetical protein
MKIKPFLITFFTGVLVACSSITKHPVNVELPKNSIGSERTALANDMLASVGLFIERNLDCSDWSLEEITDSKAEGQIVFTSDGQLYRGKAIENWTLQQCGQKLILSLEITPASQGGSVIRIKRL